MSEGRIRRVAGACMMALAALVAAPPLTRAAETSTLTVVSSFPPSLYEPFRAAFEAAHPQWRLRIINRKTSSAIDYVQSGRDGQLDVFWASAPDAFEVLKASGHLAPIAAGRLDAPRQIGGFPLNDADGMYLGFALSGYGLFWNQAYFDRHGLPPPRDWRDLADPVYARHIAMSPPSRSGTMHLMVEALLQSVGWERGWALLQEIGGNVATFTARSFSVVEGVARQRFGLGVTIDFLGLSYSPKYPNTRFVYPRGSLFLPASVAVLKDAPNRAAAEAFVGFLLSARGQELLLHPDILRMPISQSAYAQAAAGYPNPYQLADPGGAGFDSALSSRRYKMVNVLFDHLITYRLPLLQEVWQRIHAGEAALRERAQPEAAALLLQARQLATAMPLTAAEAEAAELAAKLGHAAQSTALASSQVELDAQLGRFAVEHLEQARHLADLALERLSVPAAAAALRQ
ncbi:MAG TPA: extracellular solute-binding protein [Gammaproteobacteria bacterium]|nr:extracellular solute-binding protein [Gammaproteobacteria bacterium]